MAIHEIASAMRLVFLCVLIHFTCACADAQETKSAQPELPPAHEGVVDFDAHIQPILQRACVSCHGPAVQKGGLRLDTGTNLLEGGNHGKVVLARKAERSPLLRTVAGLEPKMRMPPGTSPPLSPKEIGVLRAWIDQGAELSRGTLVTRVEGMVTAFTKWWPDRSYFSFEFNVYGALSVFLVALICGAVGSLVVANRMAFFSDALAHCSFAGAAFGLLLGLILGASDEGFRRWIVVIMIQFGIIVGLLIAYVQEKSGLPSDTVIGVFFAGAIGLGAIFMKTIGSRKYFNLENFLFGNPLSVTATEILWLLFLLMVTWVFLIWNYNTLVFASFNESLAFSRHLQVRLGRYLFIALLGLIVNLCLQVVGVLLVNALLIVPAAAAGNFARNMRQLFWGAIVLGLLAGWLGMALSWEVVIPDPLAPSHTIMFGQGGVIVVINVLFFVVSMILGPRWKARASRA